MRLAYLKPLSGFLFFIVFTLISFGAHAQISGTLSACVGSSSTLTGTGVPDPSDPWTSDNVTVATIDDATGVVTALGAGTTNITYTDENGVVTGPVSFTVYALPSATIIPGGPTTFCTGESVTLTASAATNYTWSTGATTQSIIVSTSGNYTVTVTDGNGCEATSNATFVTVNPLPVTPTISAGGPTTFCSGGSVTLTSSAASGYSWNTTATTQSILVATGGNYTVTISDANGCQATSTATAVAVNTITAGSIGSAQTICSGTDPAAFSQLTAPTGAGTITYQWQISLDNSTWSDISGANAPAFDETTALTQNTYYRRLVISTLNGVECSAATSSVLITINTLTSAGSISGDQTICNGVDPANLTSTALGTGNGTITYLWEVSVDNVNFTIATGTNNTAGYNVPAALTASRWYRRRATSALNGVQCIGYSNTVAVTVQDVVNGGTVGSDQTICTGVDPALITEVTPATGSGTLTYQWYVSSSAGFGSPSLISGATSATFDPTLSANRYYRRTTTSTLNGSTCTAVSNIVSVTVNTVSGGTIAASQTFCSEGGDPAPFAVSVASTGLGALTYQWQISLDNSAWSDIIGATSDTYDETSVVIQNTYFRRVVTSTANGVQCSANSNTITIFINSVTSPGVIGASQTICSGGDPVGFTSPNGATGVGGITYMWEVSTDNANFVDVGVITATYNVPAGLTETSYYRRRAISTLNSVPCVDYSNTLTVTVQQVVEGGTIGPDQTICSNTDPGLITELTPATGSGTFSYSWQVSTTLPFAGTPISGANAATYDPTTALTANRYYRRTVTSTLNDNQCTATSNVMTVNVNTVTAGTVASNQTFCENGGNPAPFTVATSATGAGTLSYQWQVSSDNNNWSNIVGATSDNYDEPSLITQTTYYRRITTSTLNGVQCSANGTSVTVLVNVVTAGSITAGPQTVCNTTGDPANITSSALPSGSGTLTYIWQTSTDQVNWTNVAGNNSSTYNPPPGYTQTTYVRRTANYLSNGTTCTAASNMHTIIVQATVFGGVVGNSETLCSGANPSAFVEITPSTGTGALTYRWQTSTNNSTWTNLAATGTTTDVNTALTATTYYRRQTTSTLSSNACTGESNTITVTVNTVSSGSNLTTPQSVCGGGSVTLTQPNPQPSGAGTLTYQWQQGPSISGPWTTISGATARTYTTPALITTTYYQRVTTSTLNSVSCTSTSNAVTVSVSGNSPFQSVADGNWSTGANWQGGAVPGQTSGSASCPVIAQNDMTLTAGVSISTGIYSMGDARFSSPGTITVSGGTVLGIGTNFTSSLIGKKIYARSLINYGAADATVGTITGVTSTGQLSINNGSIEITSPTAYYIGTDVEDAAGGAYYGLTMNRGNSNNTGVNGILEVESGIANFENGLTMQATNLVVRAGATLILGPIKCAICDPGDPAYNATECAKAEYNDCRQTRLSTGSASYITIEKYGRIIVYGNFLNNSQTGPILTNGLLYIVGTYSSTGTQEIVQQVPGEGDIYTTGTMSTQGNSTVFEFKDVTCPTACSGNALRCGFSNSISPSGSIAFCTSSNITLTGTTTAAYSFDMAWERSTVSASAGFGQIGGTLVTITSGAKQTTYPVTSNTGSTWYRVRIDGRKADNTPCTAYTPPVEVVSGANVWLGGPAVSGYSVNEWHNPVNWCNGVLPGEFDNVSINPGQTAIIYRNGVDGLTPARARNLDILDGATVLMQNASPELIIYGNLNAAGGTLDGNAGTVKFAPGLLSTTVAGTGNVIVNDIEVQTGKTVTFYDDLSIRGNARLREGTSVVDLTNATVVFLGGNMQAFPGTGSTASLTVSNLSVEKTGGSLQFNNGVSLYGNMTFDVSASGTVDFNGKFVVKSTGSATEDDGKIGPVPSAVSLTGNVRTERWMAPVTAANFRYLSSPVEATGLLANFKSWFGSRIMRYDAALKRYALATTIVNGTGYVAETSFKNAAWYVNGTVRKGSITWSLPEVGWHLLGNPYPSPIRWSAESDAWERTNIASTVAVTDNTVAGYPNYFRYFDYLAEEQEWGSNDLNQGMIAMGQGFWVYSYGAGSLTIKEFAKELDIPGQFYRDSDAGPTNMLEVRISRGDFGDNALLLVEKPGKSNSEEFEKLFNPDLNVYYRKGALSLLRHTKPSISESDIIPLGIEVSTAGEYSLSFPGVDNFAMAGELYLIDQYAGISMPLSGVGSYTFAIEDASRPINDRFFLSRNPEYVWNAETAVTVYPNPVAHELRLRVVGVSEPVDATFIDASGKTIKTVQFNNEGTIDVSQLNSGVFFLKIKTSKGIFTRKIIKY